MLIPYTRLLFLIPLLGLFPPGATSTSFIVDTGYARYLGNNSLPWPKTVAYLGIPYAEPPVGERRFRAPLPLNTARISAVAGHQAIDSRSYPDFCIQGTTGYLPVFGGAGSEDCLKLNIYTPTSGKNLPVLVYIHGGGYIYGNPANWPFEHWVQQSPNVVIVSVYYRLSSFGFLATPEFRDHVHGDLNVGFLDQVEALKWVQQHIHFFGGDPTRVTINGQSAGAGSVELHVVADHGHEGLFSGAIPQSIYRAQMPPPEQMQPLFDYFTTQVGCASGGLASKMACLRQADISLLTRAQDLPTLNTTVFPHPYNAFLPVVDGEIFTQSPTLLLLAGSFAKVSIMVGSTSNETGATSGVLSDVLASTYPHLTASDLAQFNKVYPLSDFDDASQQVRIATGQSRYICGQTIVADAFSRQGLDTWAYRYNQPTPGSVTVEHASENWMMFRGSSTGNNGTGTFSPQTTADAAFAEELIAYWLSFVRSKNPNSHKLARSPTWNAYDSGKRIVLQEAGSLVETEPAKEHERCVFVLTKAPHEQN